MIPSQMATGQLQICVLVKQSNTTKSKQEHKPRRVDLLKKKNGNERKKPTATSHKKFFRLTGK